MGRSDSGRTVTLKNSRNDHNLFYGKEVKADVNTSTPVWKQNVDKWK